MNIAKQLDFLGALLSRAVRPRAPLEKPAPDTDAALTASAREILCRADAADLAGRVQARWNARMRSTAGTAYVAKGLITLNPRLRDFGEEHVNRTLRHELAHLLAQHRAGRRRISPHGAEWQRACRNLGLPDEERCHTLPLPRRQLARRHIYRCPVCAEELRRVRPLRRRVACFACCRAHNGGHYHERFRLEKRREPKP